MFLLTSCFTTLDKKWWMFEGFKNDAKCNEKISKGVKLSTLQNGCVCFSLLFQFWPPKFKISVFHILMIIKCKVLFWTQIYFIILIQITSVQYSNKCLYFWLCNDKKQVTVMISLFEMHFLTFPILVHENKCHFWNPKTELDKKYMILPKIWMFESWPNLTWPWTFLRSSLNLHDLSYECHHQIVSAKLFI